MIKLAEFEEQNVIIAEDQPEYLPLPAHVYKGDPEGKILFCWQMNWKERLIVLFTGKLWHHVLTFNQPLQPQMLDVVKPVIEAEAAEDEDLTEFSFICECKKSKGYISDGKIMPPCPHCGRVYIGRYMKEHLAVVAIPYTGS